jgi:Flp pilus assembly pilin Flp
MKQLLFSLLLMPFFCIAQVQIGQDINGEALGDQSGQNVSISGDASIIAIGAKANDGNGSIAGHVRLFKNIGGSWTQIGDDIDGEVAGDVSGDDVSLNYDGTAVAIGAIRNSENGSFSGHVRIYKNIDSVWTQIGEDIDGEVAGDRSGFSISINNSGNIVAIGAPDNDANGIHSGHVRIYQNIESIWTQIGDDIDGEAELDGFGSAVSINGTGNKIAIGGPTNDGNGFFSGHVRIFKNVEDI